MFPFLSKYNKIFDENTIAFLSFLLSFRFKQTPRIQYGLKTFSSTQPNVGRLFKAFYHERAGK